MALNPGRVLNDRYRIARLLGQGDNGAVYQSWDQKLDTPCALKEIITLPEGREDHYKAHTDKLITLKHSNLPAVYGTFSVPDLGHFIVMEYVEGEDLETMLARLDKPLPLRNVIRWMSQVCDALTFLHSQQPALVHGDVKPANIIITPGGRAVLVDYGLVSLVGGEEFDVLFEGAISYLPPGTSSEAIDAQLDVYSLGATTFTLLTNEPPPEETKRAQDGFSIMDLVMELNPIVPIWVARAIEGAMEADSDSRILSSAAFKRELSGGMDQEIHEPIDMRAEFEIDAVNLESDRSRGERLSSLARIVGYILLVGLLIGGIVFGALLVFNMWTVNQETVLSATETQSAVAEINRIRLTDNALGELSLEARATRWVGTATQEVRETSDAATATISSLTTSSAATSTWILQVTETMGQAANDQATRDTAATATLFYQSTAQALELNYQQALIYMQDGYWQEAYFKLQDVIKADPNYKDVGAKFAEVEAQLELAYEVETTKIPTYNWRKRYPILSPSSRRDYSLVMNLQSGQALLFGGFGQGAQLRDTWLWNGEMWVSSTAGIAPPARDSGVMVYDYRRGRIVLFGGRGVDGLLDDTWEYDGSWSRFPPLPADLTPTAAPPENDTAATPEGGEPAQLTVTPTETTVEAEPIPMPGNFIRPEARQQACGAYDRARNEMVIFGGSKTGSFFSDTWTFDGKAWALKETPASPSARVGCAMVYDIKRQVIVLFGGNSGAALNDTWEWNGERWLQLSPGSSPPGRAFHAMVYHPALRSVLIFGGERASCSLYKDTWAYDGNSWVELNVGPPGTRAHISSDYDPQRNSVILFGGLSTDEGVCQNSQVTWEMEKIWISLSTTSF